MAMEQNGMETCVCVVGRGNLGIDLGGSDWRTNETDMNF
jgi:hypothetical protein